MADFAKRCLRPGKKEERDGNVSAVGGLDRLSETLSTPLPEPDRRWPQSSAREDGEGYGTNPRGFPEP